MENYYYILLTIFAIIVYMMIVDRNVSDFIVLLSKIARLKIENIFWIVKLHPKNPITNLLKKWEYDKLARELEKEFQQKANLDE